MLGSLRNVEVLVVCVLGSIFGLLCFLGFFGYACAVQASFSNIVVVECELVVEIRHDDEIGWLWQAENALN